MRLAFSGASGRLTVIDVSSSDPAAWATEFAAANGLALIGEVAAGVTPETHEWVDGALAVRSPSPPPVPSALTRVQFLLVADSIGLDEPAIEALIASELSLSESERRGLLIRFRHAREFLRADPAINLLAGDLTPSQVDDLFRYGAKL